MESFNFSNTYDETRQRSEALNPIHANVTPQPIKTPLEVQLGLTTLLIRYLPRAISKSIFDSASPNFLHKISGADTLRDFYAEGVFRQLESELSHFYTHHWDAIKDLWKKDGSEYLTDVIKRYHKDGVPVGENFVNKVSHIHRMWDASKETENTITFFMERNKLTKTSRRNIRSAMSEALFELIYDVSFGLGSLAYTRYVQRNVLHDIMTIYSEAVSYENGKNPRDITKEDINKSDNEIIQSTIVNHARRRAYRYGISLIPLLKALPPLRGLQWGEMAIGAWGGLWAYDIWGRQPTMLEGFRSFVNDRLNPLYGVSDPIKSADIINLYQQYAYRFSPDQAFHSISMNDEDSNLMWAQSEKIFVRIAQLMNESYNFKHTTQLDPKTNAPIVHANFMLPKFIYLLGHGLINARKPEWSMTFIEVANQYGMEDVRKIEHDFRNGRPLEEVLKDYPVDLNPNKHINGVTAKLTLPGAVITTPEKAPYTVLNPAQNAENQHTQPSNANEKPKTKVETASLKAANKNLTPPSADRAIA